VARARELEGDFRGAAQRYLACGLRDEAARVMLLESDAEPRLERRIALASIAAETAQSEALIREARGRKARTALDVLRQSGRVAKAELCRVGAELEAAGEASLAAEAYALAGDDEGEARALTAAGAVERLEQRLRESADQERSARDEGLALARIGDLDQMGERGRALALAQKTPGERAAELARVIVARLARGPVVELELEGASQRVVLGDDVTLGRGDASISIAARAVSRRHLRVARGADGAPFVEDLGTANGTRVAGARLAGRLPVGDGIELALGGDVPCRVAPGPYGGVRIEVAGESFVAPLGELRVGPISLRLRASDGAPGVTAAPCTRDRPCFLGVYEITGPIELCVGDALSAERSGAALVRVRAAETIEPSL
jgi:hypothetical protein